METTEILHHRTRQAIYSVVRAEPGITPPEMRIPLPFPWSTLVYHLGVLERAGLIASLVDGRHKRLFSASEVPEAERGRIAALRNQRTRLLYEEIGRRPGTSQRALASHLGIADQALTWHLHRLERAEMIHRRRLGRQVLVFPRRDIVAFSSTIVSK